MSDNISLRLAFLESDLSKMRDQIEGIGKGTPVKPKVEFPTDSLGAFKQQIAQLKKEMDMLGDSKAIADKAAEIGKLEEKIKSLTGQTELAAEKGGKINDILSQIGTIGVGITFADALKQIPAIFEDLFNRGLKLYEQQEALGTAFRQTGLSGADLDLQMQKSALTVDNLSNKYAVSKSVLRDHLASLVQLTGATGANRDKLLELATGIETVSNGEINASMIFRAFGKNIADPETQANLGRLTARFPALAAALKDVKDPSEMVSRAFEAMSPSLESLQERADGSAGTVKRFEIALDDVKNTLGTIVFQALTPFLKGLNDVIPVIGNVVGAIASLGGIFDSPVTSAMKMTNEQLKLNLALQDYTKKQIDAAAGVPALASEYEKLASKSTKTAEENNRMQDILRKIGDIYPDIIKSNTDYAGSLADVKRAAGETANTIAGLTGKTRPFIYSTILSQPLI